MKDSFFITSKKKPIAFIASHSCITQSISSKYCLTSEELLARAYKNKILDLKQSYFFYSFFQSLTQEYHCFFSPKISQTSATLDLLLPARLKPQLCCIFLSEQKNYFCFYQDHMLVFCKEFQDDLQISLQQVRLFFDYEVSEIFCLCYPQTNAPLLALQQHYNLIPLLSLFSPHLSFELSCITSPIVLKDFYDLNPQNSNASYKNLKIIASFLGIVFILLGSMALGMNVYHSHLLKTFESLNQHISSASFASPIEEIRHLRMENQQHLASLAHFSLLDSQKLNTLSSILPLISPDDFLSIHFNAPDTFSFLFKDHFNISSLIATLNTLGYRCKFFKEQNGIHLEISKA